MRWGVRLPVEGESSSSAQFTLDHGFSGSKKTALKRRSSVFDNDIGSLGHMGRIRQKSNLVTSRGLSASVSDSPLSIIKSGVCVDPAQQPSSSIKRKPLPLNEAKHSDKKLSSENTQFPVGAQGSATSVFATSQSQSIPFGSSTSSFLSGLSENTSFSLGSSISPSSSVTDAFSSGSSTGLSTSASPSTANVCSSISGATSSLFGPSSWQDKKSPFSSTFNSSSSSGFSFGASSGSVSSTSSASGFSFGASIASVSSTSSSSSGFSFGASSGSVSSTSSSSGFSFGASSASVLSTSSLSMFGSSAASFAPTASTPMSGPFTSVASTTSTPMFGSSTSSASATTSMPMFGSSGASVASTTSTPMFESFAVASTTSTPMFGGSSLSASSSPIFSFTSAGMATSTQPVFGNPNSVFSFGSAANNDQMSMEDSMAEDPIQSASPATPAFGQQPVLPQSNFVFGAPPPSASPFKFGTQQNIAPHSSSPFQASGSLELNGAGSFSLVVGGGDKSGHKFVKVSKNRARKASPVTPAFGQQPALPQSNFDFGAPPPSGASPFQFGTQQNIAPQSSSPFQAPGSLEFNGAGSFSLGTGGGDKSGRKYVKVSKNGARKASPVTLAFGQQPALPQSNFDFGAPPPSGASPFQFGTQQNIALQSSSPFQAPGSLEFNGAGNFSLGTGGGDKSGRKYVKVSKNRGRKK